MLGMPIATGAALGLVFAVVMPWLGRSSGLRRHM